VTAGENAVVVNLDSDIETTGVIVNAVVMVAVPLSVEYAMLGEGMLAERAELFSTAVPVSAEVWD
jgi:hypothetical protein